MTLFWLWGPLVLVGGVAWAAWNRVATLDARCDRAQGDIDVQLKMRHAILPNLVETVRGLADHERGIIQAVLDARIAAAQAGTEGLRLRAEADLQLGMTRLVQAAESYPQLRANEHFAALRTELADAEHKIAAARRFFNSAVAEYNGTIGQFPANLMARLSHRRRRAGYDIGVERVLIDEPPTISFAGRPEGAR